MYLNWGEYSDDMNYDLISLLTWQKVSDSLTVRLKQLESEGVPGDNMFLYGHSIGGRIAIHSGLKFGKNKIANIDACDNAGYGF